MSALVEVFDFSVAYGAVARPVAAVRNVSMAIAPGEIVGIVGESGSGKSTLCKGLIRALGGQARIAGEVRFDGRSLYDLPAREVSRLHGRELSMVLQNPLTALDPLYTIGNQLQEVLGRRGVPRAERKSRAIAALRDVYLTAPELRATQYPHQLSGGMRQRALIAMATCASPKLLVADEPTSALDATIQDEILLLFRELRDRSNCAVLLVTHEIEVVRRVCDRIIVMYAGAVVETGDVASVLDTPRHPYTRALIDSTPRIEGDQVRLTPIPGQVPHPGQLGDGCAFADRCVHVMPQCRTVPPPQRRFAGGQTILCHLERGLA